MARVRPKKGYGFQFCDASSSNHGLMNCAGCGQRITEGQYRVYKRSKSWDWHYVTHHRDCCPDDPAWAELDRKARMHRDMESDRERIRQEFREKWGEEFLS